MAAAGVSSRARSRLPMGSVQHPRQPLMGRRITAGAADERFAVAGLEPLEPYVSRTSERRCRCRRCGTTRWVKLSVLDRGGIACRWCHGWEKWVPWSQTARERAATWRSIDTSPEASLAKVEQLGLLAVTPPGDEYTPVGFLCPRCGETGVTVPERIGRGERGYFGCPRCAAQHTRQALDEAPRVFDEHGLRLTGRCRGEYVPQDAECLACGTLRKVALAELRDGTASLCWTCTHGIRPDEPHRIYLVHFPALRAMKVGLTHARHDRRLFDHELAGGHIIDTADVPNRAAARFVERTLMTRYAAWATIDLSAAQLPQGGWTETWRDDAPLLELAAEVDRILEDYDP